MSSATGARRRRQRGRLPAPDGWWKDRAGAARRLHERLLVADTSYDDIVLVLEGAARGGVRPAGTPTWRTVHAPRDGDAEIRERGDGVRARPVERASSW